MFFSNSARQLEVPLRGYYSYNNPSPQKTALLFTVYLLYILTKCSSTITEVAYSCVFTYSC